MVRYVANTFVSKFSEVSITQGSCGAGYASDSASMRRGSRSAGKSMSLPAVSRPKDSLSRGKAVVYAKSAL